MYPSIAFSFVTLASLLSTVSGRPTDDWSTGKCTYHPYEEDLARLGGTAYDNAPGWCGIRYTALNIQRIVAVSGLGASMCAQCIEFRGAAGGPTMYVLAVDQKGSEGLDVSHTSFQNAFPSANALDPQTCAWRITDPSNCAGVCRGSAEECTPGVRNLLPAYLLPAIGSSFTPIATPTPKPAVTTDQESPEKETTTAAAVPTTTAAAIIKITTKVTTKTTTRTTTTTQDITSSTASESNDTASKSTAHISESTATTSESTADTSHSSSSLTASATQSATALSLPFTSSLSISALLPTSQPKMNGGSAPAPHYGAGVVSASLPATHRSGHQLLATASVSAALLFLVYLC
ncbi:hypothetical protein BASA50_003918 [Batrachochytrium salamandrivorans]|uniref:Expansin-like EG45 domain-containing protein n=1 Tax=Batrachochytrium salamandrivorans TaxID=1357716 RepID=A0ABQ8FHC8_9FUNG|nr:hypothetical protein BASA60_008638 [Batrachochytrium salamandrivorans]KAH6574580.1 hypothetical protein BASA62_002379 [Batrachochytrium salamandrivorans]KAH6598304.1 hypothetical protein BASA50_003918 [Batrachochytrium salamandrivorans]KAH6602977.1 hypothetical protein BASA61_000603 [Batrachochytrium salamandrivorans]KAH9245180.1 hypothetical protein BASA81_017357 [Batrachochytrium salamandrivorans]